MTHKIIHISFMKPELFLWKALFIDETLKAGYQTEYWDITALFFETNISSFTPPQATLTFTSLNDFQTKLATYNPYTTLINIQFSFEYRFRKIFDEVAKYNFTKFFFAIGDFPTPHRSPITFAKRLMHPQKLKAPLLTRFAFFWRNRFGSSPLPDIVFASGQVSASKHPKSTIIPINAGDYDSYLAYLDSPVKVYDYPYVVFIDQNLPSHPDLSVVGAPAIPKEKYYQELNRLFEIIEQTYHMPVVIAVHPKACYTGNEFGEREIVNNMTLPLIAASSLVLAHYSNAVGIAVAASKPIIFLVSDDIKILSPNLFYLYPKLLSEVLMSPLINISQADLNIPSQIPVIDHNAYLSYLYSYLTWPENEYSQSCDNYLNALKNTFELISQPVKTFA